MSKQAIGKSTLTAPVTSQAPSIGSRGSNPEFVTTNSTRGSLTMNSKVSNLRQLVIKKSGVFLIPPVGSSGPAEKIAERIQVQALVTNEGTSAKLLDIVFLDRTGKPVKITMTPSDFAKFSTFRDTVLDHGYVLPSKPRLAQMLHAHLWAQNPRMQRHILHRQGWHQKRFVFAGASVRLGDQILSFEPAHPDHARNFGCAGTLDGWKEGVAMYAEHSTRLTLAISLAFAAALLPFCDVESGGIHLVGDSGMGKTTLLLAASSVGGKAVRNNLYSWDVTRTGLEELAGAYNHMLLCLDEIERAANTATRAREVRDAVFRLASGTGRIRSAIYGKKIGNSTITWKLFFLSTGETSLNEVASMDALGRLKGEVVRAIDLPAKVHDQYGIFESLPSEYTASVKLVERIEAECLRNYGVALREFVKRIAQDQATIRNNIAKRMETFYGVARVPKERWQYRFAKRFALAYAAAMLAVKYDVVPWNSKKAARAIITCYSAARETIPDVAKLRSAGLAKVVSQLSGGAEILNLARSGHNRRWSTGDLQNAEAFRRAGKDGTQYLVDPKTFIGWFDSQLQADLVLAELDRCQLLVKDRPNLKTLQVSISGIAGRRRYYALRKDVLSMN